MRVEELILQSPNLKHNSKTLQMHRYDDIFLMDRLLSFEERRE